MNGFVLGSGRSGTLWTADTLSACTDLDVRHESMGQTIGAGFRGVEVNGFLRNQVPDLRQRFPDATLIHLVRDGRLVVRSVMSRHPDRYAFRECCRHWAATNARLADQIPAHLRFRLEDLTTSFTWFRVLAFSLGAGRVWRRGWAKHAHRPLNATGTYAFPAPEDWTESQRRTFLAEAGAVMTRMGYDQ